MKGGHAGSYPEYRFVRWENRTLKYTRDYISSHPSSTRVYRKVSGLATWSENCEWHSSLPLGTVLSLFCEPF
jgi:hypothetical protein